MDLQVLHRTEELIEEAARSGVTVVVTDEGKLRLRRDPRLPAAALAAGFVQRLKDRRDDVATVLAIPRPTVDQGFERDERGWIWLAGAIGLCVVCDEPCRSWDDENRPRHPTCGIEAA